MSASFTYSPLERLTLHDSQIPFQSPNSAIMTSQEQWEQNRNKNGLKPIGIRDDRMPPMFEDEAARIRQEATDTISKIQAMLRGLSVGSTWDRSAEDSMREYQLLDSAAQAIDVLKVLNIRDREELRQEAESKRKEDELCARKALKYWVHPEEMEKTRKEMRGMRERGSRITCLEDCMKTLMYDPHPRWAAKPGFVYVLENVQWAMDRVQTATVKLETESRDGHWAIGLLNFYSDAWICFLDELNSEYLESWWNNVPEERIEEAKQRAKLAEDIIEEVRKEKKNPWW